ncbi:MAG: carboxypeptidase-like regulatory domain-containing protein [Bacteroidota bacterium]
MKKNDDNKKLKQLSDQHEVPFRPAAWDRMEALLDGNTPPPELPPPGSSFFNYKNILAMLVLLMILIFFLFPTSEVPQDKLSENTTTKILSQDIYKTENDTTKQTTKEITTENAATKTPKTGALTTDGKVINPNDPSPRIISEPAPVLFVPVNTPLDSLNKITYTQTIPPSKALMQNVETQLTTYHDFREEEKVYLHFDRTMLKPGESLWFSAYVRNANTLKPSKKSDILYVEFIAPNGGVLKQLKLVTEDGIAEGDIQTNLEMVGGIYKIKAYTNWQKNFNTTFEREITLQKTVLPHLRMELDFEKEAYGGGDVVVAQLDLNTLENTALTDFDFSYTVSLAGNQIMTKNAKTDAKGHADLTFNLPNDLDSNDGLVNVMLQYNGQGESISRSIPIVLGKMDLQFFPEGGDMIAGLKNKVAFKVLNEFGKPADVAGIVINANGETVANFQSYHQGMGAFNFKPLPNEKYTAKITKPTNIKGEFPLPQSLANGNLMQVVQQDDEKMQVLVQSADSQSLTIVLQSQGNVVYSTATTPKVGEHLIEIPTRKFPIGIAQLTMFDASERPHAERLVFLNKNKTLDIQISTDKEQYLPREKVRMQIDVKDEDGNPVRGQFSVGVTDDKLLTFADDKQGKILAYLLLESDLKGKIEKPNFYFEPKEKHPNKDQALALDYLMMTHGWRRFAWKRQGGQPIANLTYPNEKAIISGTVLDQYGAVVSDAVVTVEGLNTAVITDEEGKFYFENIPLIGLDKNQSHLTISASKGETSKILVNNYGENYQVRLVNNLSSGTKLRKIPANGNSQIKGRILDDVGEALIGANVILNGTTMGTSTDFDGYFILKNVPAGQHVIQFSYTGYNTKEQVVNLRENESLIANATMDGAVFLDEVVVTNARRQRRSKRKEFDPANTSSPITVTDYREPLIQQDNTTTGGVVTSEQIRNLPTRNINAVAATAVGVKDMEEKLEELAADSDDTVYDTDGTLTGNREVAIGNFDLNFDANILVIDGSVNQVGIGTPSPDAKLNIDDDSVKFSDYGAGTSPESELLVQGYLASQFPTIGHGSLDNSLGLNETSLGGSIKESSNNKLNNVAIRGNNTIIYTEEPTVIIDGDVMDKLSSVKIKPEDIRSAEVLDGQSDAYAAAYGKKSKNDVIVIDTKKRKGGRASQVILDYQNEMIEDINDQVKAHEQRFEWAKKMIFTQSLTLNQTRDLRIALNASLTKIQNMQSAAAELGRLTGVYPRTDYANRDFQFIEDYEYAHTFKNGYYAAREFYVPKYVAKAKKEARDDFRPTIFWDGKVETNANGSALLEFYNSDDLTTFKVTVEGLTPSGKIGTATHTYFTQMPFGMRTKFPNQVLMGDILNLPVTIANNTNAKMLVKLDAVVPQGFEYVGKKLSPYALDQQEVKTIYLPFKVKSAQGEHELEVKVSANGQEDSFSKTVKVLSRGFPINMMFSGNDLEQNFEVEVKDVVESSMKATFTVHPTLVSDLSKGMERMVRQPTGCFEQTSSKNYPNLLVLGYLNNTNNLDQDLGKKLYDVLEKGYQRLLTFEVQGGGFDWYGSPPAHEGLTAYGLMQFKDMQRVHRVDQDLIDRTAEWLLTRKDGNGGWRNSKAGLHTWSGGSDAGNAYITWAMTEAGFGGKVRPEIEATYATAKTTKDAYIMALAVNALHNINDGRANKLLQELLKLQKKDGSWAGKTTMTRSGGKSLKIETTALAAMAIMKVNKGLTQLEKAMKFIAASKTDYGFGSTQSTVLAMKALIDHAKFSKQMQTDGTVKLMIDGKEAASQTYTAGQKATIVFDDIQGNFTEGKHDVKVLFEGTQVALPYDLAVNYNTALPKSDTDCKVQLKTELQRPEGKIAENIRLTVHLQNVTNEALPNTIAKIGIPAGLNLQPWQLKELQDKNAFDFFEIMDGSLVLHYRGMQPAETKTVHLDLKADLAGTYEAPASVAYLYYTNEYRSWSKPESVKINQ